MIFGLIQFLFIITERSRIMRGEGFGVHLGFNNEFPISLQWTDWSDWEVKSESEITSYKLRVTIR